jgi:hypothetical protein
MKELEYDKLLVNNLQTHQKEQAIDEAYSRRNQVY